MRGAGLQPGPPTPTHVRRFLFLRREPQNITVWKKTVVAPALQQVLLEPASWQELRKHLTILHCFPLSWWHGTTNIQLRGQRYRHPALKPTTLVKTETIGAFALRLSHLCFYLSLSRPVNLRAGADSRWRLSTINKDIETWLEALRLDHGPGVNTKNSEPSVSRVSSQSFAGKRCSNAARNLSPTGVEEIRDRPQ